MTEYVVAIPGELWTVNAERNRHHYWRAARTRQWRSDAFYAARLTGIPHLERAEIEVAVEQARGKLADPGSHAPPAKAAIDGLVDAGVLPDDSPAHLLRLSFVPPIKSPDGIGRLVLTIKECP